MNALKLDGQTMGIIIKKKYSATYLVKSFFKLSPRSSYLRYVKDRNFISTRDFVPTLIFVSCVYIYMCIEKFEYNMFKPNLSTLSIEYIFCTKKSRKYYQVNIIQAPMDQWAPSVESTFAYLSFERKRIYNIGKIILAVLSVEVC